jgi:hypothetical protein
MAQEPVDRLAAAMEPIRASGYTLAQEQKVLETAVDGGSAVVSYLESVLAGSDTARRIVALKALAYIGGDSAIAALRSEYRKRPDGWTTTFLCDAVASRGNREDQDLLLRTLADRTRKPDGTSPRLAAVLSLGVLRATSAMPALERVVAEEPGTGTASIAAMVLDWMNARRIVAPLEGIPSQEAEIIAAVLENGIPDRFVGTFVDNGRGGTWNRRNGQWSFDSSIQSRDLPSMDVRVHRAPDSSRALVAIDFRFSPDDAFGYHYVMRKIPQGWKVQCVVWAWVAGRVYGA